MKSSFFTKFQIICLPNFKSSVNSEFDSLGGTAVESQRLRYGDAIEMPTTPTREDYTFDGWYYDKDGKRAVDFSTATAERSTTLYAKWVEKE